MASATADGAGTGRHGVATDGFAMRPARLACVGSLRYFAGAGDFTGELSALLGGPLPGLLQTVRHGAAGTPAEILLAWRSPTETLALCDAAMLAALEAFAAPRADVCMVNQTGGLRAWTLTGARVAEVLVRLGAPSIIPAPGEARIGRLAELTVLVGSVTTAETMLLVDRVYEEHLAAWVQLTLTDLTEG